MKSGEYPVAVRVVWALVAIFAALQVLLWVVGVGTYTSFYAFHIAASWAVIVALAFLASRRIGRLSTTIESKEDARRAIQSELEQLQTQNAMLQIVARTVDVPLAFQALAQRIAPLVACERVGLALLTDVGDEFQTYTARVQEDQRRTHPRPDIVFKAERTAIGHVVRTREPFMLNDTSVAAADFLDVNVLHTAGFGSVLLVPLVAGGRAVGTLNIVCRKANSFTQHHIDVLLPIAELFAVAYVAQQLQVSLAKHQTVEAMTELTLAISSEINGALQIIIGHCDLLEHGYPDPNLQRDLAVVVRQAQRIVSLLEKMRASTTERLRVSAETVSHGVPPSPENFGV